MKHSRPQAALCRVPVLGDFPDALSQQTVSKWPLGTVEIMGHAYLPLLSAFASTMTEQGVITVVSQPPSGDLRPSMFAL